MQTKSISGPARFWLVLITFLFLLTAAASGWAASAPGFTLKAVQDGQEHSLSQFKGVVINLRSAQQGVQLNLGVDGFDIKMK